MTKARDLANASTALSAVSATELAFVDGVTSAIQTQMDAKTAKATLTTTGDIYYASGANTPARLGIGSSAQVLTVASGVPSWSTPASGSTFAGCSLYQTTTTTVATGVLTTLLFDTENIDTDAYHSTVTNTGRITIPTGKGGKYLIGFVLRWQGNTVAARDAQVHLNGSSIILEDTAPAPANSYGLSQTASLIYPLVAGDYIELKGSQGSGSSLTTGTGGTGSQFFAGLLGA